MARKATSKRRQRSAGGPKKTNAGEESFDYVAWRRRNRGKTAWSLKIAAMFEAVQREDAAPKRRKNPKRSKGA